MTRQHPTTHPPTHRSRTTSWAVAVVLVAIAVTFVVQNRGTITIRLFVPTVSGPLWAALAGVFVLGGLAGYLVAARRR